MRNISVSFGICRWLRVSLLVGVCIVHAGIVSAQSPNCPAANPSDSSDDSAAIQSCLDNNSSVYLEPGYPGYIIGTRLWFRSGNSLLTSVGGKATLKAGSGLTRAMLVVDGASYYTISELILDGDRGSRTGTSNCTSGPEYPGFYGMNLHVEGSHYTVHHVDTINAMCGSGLEAVGDNFEIYSVYAANNGAEAPNGPWADGITVLRCDGGYVHNNAVVDNTDIGLAIGRGEGCLVRYNTVSNVYRRAFAGMSVGSDGSHYGSEYKDNEVTSSYDRMAFGLIIGSHPWDVNSTASNIGAVTYNSITGAVVNLAVDGIAAGTVTNNSMSSPQGSTGFNCSISANYTVAHYGSATLQGSWDAARHYHAGGCGTP